MGIGLADVLVKGKLPRSRAWFVGIGHGKGDCLCAGTFDLGAKASQTSCRADCLQSHVRYKRVDSYFSPSDGLRLLSKSLPVSVHYTMFVYVLLFVAL